MRIIAAQRINGAEALALPELDAQTVWLTMTQREKRTYDMAPGPRHGQFFSSSAAFRLEMAFLKRRQALANMETKMEALEADVVALRAREPCMHRNLCKPAAASAKSPSHCQM